MTARHPSRLTGLSGSSLDPVRIRLLGAFKVSVGSRIVEEGEWRLRKAAALVKLLALASGHRIHREQAMDILWPNLGRKAAANNLRQALYAARKALHPDPKAASNYLSSKDETLALCPEINLWVDVEAFEEAARAARRAKEPSAYEAALDLYAGELLPQDRYEEWAEERRQNLHETYVSLLIGLASAYEQRGEFDSATEALRKAVSEDPTREEAHASLMRLYALSGSKAEALRQYETLRENLSRELGVEPSTSSRALREEIAAGRLQPSERPVSTTEAGAQGPPPHNLPTPRTSFVGRLGELVEVKRELTMTRLLTLTGTGGTGKTRLAVETAREPPGPERQRLGQLRRGTGQRCGRRR
jgi:DNA-binding SARP family transcriptional activator